VNGVQGGRGIRRRLVLAMVAVLAMLAAACGDDDGDAASGGDDGSADQAGGGGSASECDSPGVSADEITIGQLSSLTTPAAAFYGLHQAGFKARIDKLNDDGGIGGRQVVIETADDAADINRATAAARELVEQQDAFAIMVASSVIAGPASYLSDEGIPVVGYNVNPEWGTYDNMFGYSGSNSPEPTATTTGGEFLTQQGVERLAILGYAQTSAQAAAEGMQESFEAAGGEVVYNSTDAPIGNAEWTAQAEEIASSGADGLYLPIQTQNALAAAAAVRQAGADLTVTLFPAGYSPTTLEQAGDTAEGVYFSMDFVPLELDLPAHQEMLDGLEQYAPDTPPAQEVVVGWIIGDLLIRGIQEAGEDCPTREAFIENLRQVTDFDANGLMDPPVDFEASFGQPYGTCFHYVKVEGGAFVPVNDGEAICGEPVDGG
jgi:branched-chain amino acid transport system substrate-binding protein